MEGPKSGCEPYRKTNRVTYPKPVGASRDMFQRTYVGWNEAPDTHVADMQLSLAPTADFFFCEKMCRGTPSLSEKGEYEEGLDEERPGGREGFEI